MFKKPTCHSPSFHVAQRLNAFLFGFPLEFASFGRGVFVPGGCSCLFRG